MALFSPTSQNPLGLHPGRQERVRAKARGSAISKGNVVYFDLAAGDPAVTAATVFGGATNPTANVLLATATHDNTEANDQMYLHGVAAEDIPDDDEGWIIIRGVCQALGADTSGAGSGLSCVAGSELGSAVVDAKVIAIALETMADATLKWVAMDGINGLGVHSAAVS